MAQQTIEINTKNLEKAIRLFPKQLKFELGDAFDHIARSFISDFRKVELRGITGRMRRPMGIFRQVKKASLVSKDIEGMGVHIFSDSEIAERQQKGKTITGSGGKVIAPLGRTKELFTPTGRLKKKYWDSDKVKHMFKINVGGKTYLVQRKKQVLKFLYVLKDKIKINPQLKFYETWDHKINKRMLYINKAVDKALKATF